MNANLAQIQMLHGVYTRLTGYELRLDPARERLWWEFVQAGFTADDLVLVVRHVRQGIKLGARQTGALKLSNLLGRLDFFEEDLAMAKASARQGHYRDQEQNKPEPRISAVEDNAKSVQEIVSSPAFQSFCKLKEKL